MLNGRGKKWKAAILDYDALQSYDDEIKCVVCLTEREAAALHGYIRGMSWPTRWVNLPSTFDLKNWVAEIEGELINTMCGNNPAVQQIADCLCELTNLVKTQTALDVEPTFIVIPPDNPSENLPALDPDPTVAEEELRYDAALCDVAKISIETIFETVYQGQLANCNDDSGLIDWGNIASTVSTVFFVGATVFPAAAGVLFAGGVAYAAYAIGAEIFDYNALISGSAGCPPERVPVEYARIYGCQLWQSLQDGITFSVWQTALSCTNSVAIEWYRANIEDDLAKAEAADQETRDLLSSFLRSGEAYQGAMQAIDALAGSPYYPTEVCTDCTNCSDASPAIIEITEWTDQRIVSISPEPALKVSDSDWRWLPSDVINITLDKTYCLRAFDSELVRGATESQPSEVTVTVGSDERSDSAGGFSRANININLDGLAGKAFTISCNDAGTQQRYDIGTTNKAIKLDPLPEYNDCGA